MAGGDHKQGEIAKLLKKLFNEIKQLAGRVSALEHQDRNVVETGIVYAGTSSPFSPFVYYPVHVTGVDSGGKVFSGQIQSPYQDGDPPYHDDSNFTDAVTVHVTTPTPAPAVGDYVLAVFTGTYGSGYNPIWGMFDRTSVSSVSSCEPPYVVYGTVNGTVTAGATTFDMDNVVAMQGTAPGTSISSVRHITGLPANDNADAVAWYDKTNSLWRGIPFTPITTCTTS